MATLMLRIRPAALVLIASLAVFALWGLSSRLSGQGPIEVIELGSASSITLIVVAGQSNATSRAPDGDVTLALPVPNIYQIARSSSSELIPATEPLQHWDTTPQGVGFGFQFAKLYSADHRDRVTVILPAARGQSGLGPEEWGGGGELAADLIDKVNGINSRFAIEDCYFLWHQGEDAVVEGSSTYAQDLDRVFAAMKDGAPVLGDCKFLVGGLADDFVRLAATGKVGKTVVKRPQAAFDVSDALRRITSAEYVSAEGLPTMDGIHFTAAAQLELGARYFSAVK